MGGSTPGPAGGNKRYSAVVKVKITRRRGPSELNNGEKTLSIKPGGITQWRVGRRNQGKGLKERKNLSRHKARVLSGHDHR